MDICKAEQITLCFISYADNRKIAILVVYVDDIILKGDDLVK